MRFDVVPYNGHSHIRIVDLITQFLIEYTYNAVLTDLTRCPIPNINLCCLRVSLTNSIGVIPESYARENWLAAPSNAPPNLSP